MKLIKLIAFVLVFNLGGDVAAKKSSVKQTASSEAATLTSNTILLTAYKREFAFLEAERDALKKRLTDLDSRMQSKVSQARTAVEAVQSKVANQDLELSALQTKLDAVDAEADAEESPEAFLSGLKTRASSALAQLGLPKISVGNDGAASVPKAIESILSRMHRALDQGASVYQREGEFFDVSGTLVSGNLWHIGYVASYGVSTDHVGMLRPAGEGRLQLVNDANGAASARALASGESGDSLSLFLYENLEKSIDVPEAKTAQGIISAGGVIAYVIAGLGIVTFLLLLGRIVLLTNYARMSASVKRVMKQCGGNIGQDENEQLLNLNGPHARVLNAVASTLRRPRQNQLDTFTEAFLTESPRLDRFSALVLVFAAIAPLLGLLGTVTGMIATFDTITQFGTGNPKLLSGGISEALITTELGLIVAIPAVLFGNLLKGWSDQMKDSIEQLCLQAMNRVQMGGVHLVLDDVTRPEVKMAKKQNVLAS
jgi:biopolymer transport protein ExbB